eukprot:CAMPEP_0184694888 /NCGR_PEP_ID=MMETSP0313-20130426/2703_1 /TAXON_ID=2792 /ORGANISM="Porphyridium aerugineum, Strain SAG 1380-2" /LENGTH=173 /DNA_ID=CAMNT_0027153249 /DNA_START=218 /DNA_END=739 /DNA_ORIENTATION=+
MSSGQGFGKNLANNKNDKNDKNGNNKKNEKSDISASPDQDLSNFTLSDALPPNIDALKRSKKSGVVLPGEMIVAFTCDVSGCNTRIARRIKKKSYDSGVVLIECPKCKNRHLIADHLGWYPWLTENGGDGSRSMKTLGDIAEAKGIHKVDLKDIEFEEVVEPGNATKSMESIE